MKASNQTNCCFLVLLVFILSCLIESSTPLPSLRAGASRVDITMPVGTPLAGYNYPPRRTNVWPLPWFTNYTTWMNPSMGVWDPNYARTLVLDNGVTQFAIISLDTIGADASIASLAYDYAVAQGFSVPRANCIFSAMHTHSGPGAISADFLFAIAASTDLMVPHLMREISQKIANSMIQAQQAMQPAKIDIGSGDLLGVTHNRRAWMSPYVEYGTIDPHLGIIRIDTMDNKPIATVWNFAIHGICYDAPNLKFTSDVAGSANKWVEDNIGGFSLFINADAGDVNPIFDVCCRNKPNFSGGPIIGKRISEVRSTLNPTDQVEIETAFSYVEFGMTQLNMTLARLDNCTRGGPLDICAFCEVLDCDANIALGPGWIETKPMFNAARFTIRGNDSVIVTVPGEALVELGWWIRNDTLDLGFTGTTILAGYTNSYLGYFAPPDEYDIGGYESLMTFWGIGTAEKVRQSVRSVASMVAPTIDGQLDYEKK